MMISCEQYRTNKHSNLTRTLAQGTALCSSITLVYTVLLLLLLMTVPFNTIRAFPGAFLWHIRRSAQIHRQYGSGVRVISHPILKHPFPVKRGCHYDPAEAFKNVRQHLTCGGPLFGRKKKSQKSTKTTKHTHKKNSLNFTLADSCQGASTTVRGVVLAAQKYDRCQF